MAVELRDGNLHVNFMHFDIAEYDTFIRSKSLPEHNIRYDWKTDTYSLTAPDRFAHVFGIEAPGIDRGWLPIADHLFDYQKFIVEQALTLKRFACWSDCVHGDTMINTPSGNFKIKDLADVGKPIEVFSVNKDGEIVTASATCPFKKGESDTIEIEMASGRKITVTKGHVFLTPTCWKKAGDLSVQDFLCVSDPDLLQSSWELSRSKSLSNDERLKGKAEDYPDDYLTCSRQYDRQPPPEADTCQSSLPSQADVHGRNDVLLHTDDLVCRSEHIRHYQKTFLPSSLDFYHQGTSNEDAEVFRALPLHHGQSVLNNLNALLYARFYGRLASFSESGQCENQASKDDQSCIQTCDHSALCNFCAKLFEPGSKSTREFPLYHKLFSLRMSKESFVQGEHQSCFLHSSFCLPSFNSLFKGVLVNNSIYYDTVVSVKRKGKCDYYDLHVPIHENYLANGIWNHNTGTGKTAMFLEFARQILHRYQKKVLIIVPLNIITQTIDENRKFYGEQAFDIYRIKSRDDLIRWCSDGTTGVGIVNPDKFIPRDGDPEMISEIRHCMAVILDEASLLRASAGKIKWSIIKSCRGIEYKLSSTATPAPNDSMEYASQGSYLEKLRSEGEILWTFFKRDKEGNWGIRPHAKEAFYRFMAGWSIYLRSPKNYGFADNLKDLPDPEFYEYKIRVTHEQVAMIREINAEEGQLMLFASSDTKLGMVNRIKYSQIAKGFIYQDGKNPISIPSEKPAFIANLLKQEFEAGHQVIIWTVFDEESEIIKRVSDVPMQVISGKTPRSKRDSIIEDFRSGKIPVLVSKASLIGHGLNFQHCTSMIFSGFDDSFENYYQAVRRAYRYGQKKTVRIHIPYIPELEGVIWNNIIKKQNQFIHDVTVQELAYKKAIAQIMRGFES